MTKWTLGVNDDEWMEIFLSCISGFDQHLYMGTGDYEQTEEEMKEHEEWVEWKMYTWYHENAWNRWYQVDDLRY